MLYRLYAPADFIQLYAIEEVCFQPPLRFPRRYMRQLLASGNTAAWVAEDSGELAGFGIVEWSAAPDDREAYIQTIEVAPAFRRRGIALELLRKLESSALTSGAVLIWLHVDAENTPAQHLYREAGFEEKGTEPHYYGSKRTALIFAKILDGPALHSSRHPHV